MRRSTARQPGGRSRRHRLSGWVTTAVAMAVFAGLAAYAWIGREPNPAGLIGADGQVLPPLWKVDVSQVQEVRVEYPGEPEKPPLVIVRSEGDGQSQTTADTAAGEQPGVQPGSPVAYSPVSRFRGIAEVPFVTYRLPQREVDWLLRSPLVAPADSDTVNRLAQTLAEPVPQAVVRSGDELKAEGDRAAQDAVLAKYGLDQPRAVVRVRFSDGKDGEGGGAAEEEIRVGNPTPITTGADAPAGYYVYTPARPGIFTLSAYGLDSLLGEAASLRDLQVSEFETARAERIRILWSSSPAQRAVPIEAEKVSGLSAAGNPQTRWQLLAPQTLPADSTRMEAILADLANLRAQQVVDVVDEGDLARYGLDDPLGEVIVWLADGTTDEALGTSRPEAVPLACVLRVGGTSPDGSSIYVQVAGDPTVYAVDAWRLASVQDNGSDWLGLVTRLVLPSDWGWGQDLGRRLQEISWKAGGHEYRLIAQPDQWQVLADGRAGQALPADSSKLDRLWKALSALRFERVTQVGGTAGTATVPSSGSSAATAEKLARVRLLPRPADGGAPDGQSSGRLPVEIVPMPTGAGQGDALSVLLQVTGDGFTRRGEMAQATWQELVDALQDLLPSGQDD